MTIVENTDKFCQIPGNQDFLKFKNNPVTVVVRSSTTVGDSTALSRTMVVVGRTMVVVGRTFVMLDLMFLRKVHRVVNL
jgi:hypothetical protein